MHRHFKSTPLSPEERALKMVDLRIENEIFTLKKARAAAPSSYLMDLLEQRKQAQLTVINATLQKNAPPQVMTTLLAQGSPLSSPRQSAIRSRSASQPTPPIHSALGSPERTTSSPMIPIPLSPHNVEHKESMAYSFREVFVHKVLPQFEALTQDNPSSPPEADIIELLAKDLLEPPAVTHDESASREDSPASDRDQHEVGSLSFDDAFRSY